MTGKDKGTTGIVLRAMPKEGKILVEGVAIAKRSHKGVAGKVGHIVEKPMPIDASNVKVIKSENKYSSALDAKVK